MRSALLVCLTVFLVMDAAAARRRAVLVPESVQLQEVDAIAEGALAGGIPGLTVAVRRGDQVYVRGYGLHDVEQAQPAGARSVYQIGSITKQFTAAAIMLLAERGALAVSDSVRQYIPELASRFDAVTIEHLLVHASGTPDHLRDLTDPWQPITTADVIASVNAAPLAFTPGTDWAYSNSGYYLLGIVIERLTGRTYGDFLEENFFLPLGLLRTGYCGEPPLPVPDGYIDDGNATYRVPAIDMSLVHAAGALCSTAEDLLRWNDALVSGRAVSAESFERMTSRYRVDGRFPLAYGYGLALDPLDGRARIWHNGRIPGFSSHLGWYRDEGLTIVVLTNVFLPDSDPSTDIANEIARALNRN